MATTLIVDDDGSLRDALAGALVDDEHEIHTAAGGLEAIRLLQQRPVDVVLLDMVMSDGDGYAVLAHLLGVNPKPKVIVLSVLDHVRSVVTAMKLGADDYLVKPCELRVVRRAICRALATPSQRSC